MKPLLLTTFMVLFVLAVNAQESKAKLTTPPSKYICTPSTGVPLWRDLDEKERASEKEVAAARADCEAKHKAAEAAEEQSLQEFMQKRKQLQTRIDQSEQGFKEATRKMCELRDSYRTDGTDSPLCKGIPPKREVLVKAHKDCADWPKEAGAKPEHCGRLIPLSQGR
jgi:hypothetical protein